jgi:hypothetical protein
VTVLVVLLGLAAAAVAGGTATVRHRQLTHTRHPLHARPAAGRFAEVSSNWAGYALTSPSSDSPVSFTSVTGTWKQAAAKCGEIDSDSASAFWVGLGGYNEDSKALEQIGTSADCSPSGPPSYYAWYELVPGPPISFALKIEPGDMITASVTISGTTVTMQVRNQTRGTVAAQRLQFKTPDLSSAEWIVEAPSACSDVRCDVVPLANFRSIVISNLKATGNGHAGILSDPSWTATPIQLLPYSDYGYYGGSDVGYIAYNSTAGTCGPVGVPDDSNSFTVSWAAVALANC